MTPTGKLATFFAATKSGPVEITGEEIEFGLVLHPTIGPDCIASPAHGWTISEPVTGLRLCMGEDRIDCANTLHVTVVAHGGSNTFARNLEASIVAKRRGDAALEAQR